MFRAIDISPDNSFIFHGKMPGLVLIVIIITAESLVQKIFIALGPRGEE